jgi:hypothetical protein
MNTWLGLVSRQYRTGGKIDRGRTSKRGNRYIRLFIQAANTILMRPHPWEKFSFGASNLFEDAGSIHRATNLVRDPWLRMGWTPMNVCPKVMGIGGMRVQFTVGLKLKGKTDHIAVDAEDALIAALKVKTEYPEAVITYVRQQNRRGDARHPSHGLSEDKSRGTSPAGGQLLQTSEDREVRQVASLHRASR